MVSKGHAPIFFVLDLISSVSAIYVKPCLLVLLTMMMVVMLISLLFSLSVIFADVVVCDVHGQEEKQKLPILIYVVNNECKFSSRFDFFLYQRELIERNIFKI